MSRYRSYTNERRAGRVVMFIFFGIAAIFGFTWIVMLLWNGLMPDIFNLNPITYWQAMGLLVLSKIIFGFGGGGGGGRKRRWKREIPQAQWASMTAEEKERFRNEWRVRCGWQEYTGPQTSQQPQQQPPTSGTQSV